MYPYFGYLSIKKLYKVFKCSSHEINKKINNSFTSYCIYCQKHEKLPDRFKFILKKDANYNYLIFVNIIYINGNLILYVVDQITRFQVAK